MNPLAQFYAARERAFGLRAAIAAFEQVASAQAAQRRLFNRETYLIPEWPMPEAPSPDGKRFASVADGEIAVRNKGAEPRPLTSGANDSVGWDFETGGPSPWSPDGNWLFACHADRSEVQRTARTRFAGDGAVGVDWPRAQRAGTPLDIMRPHLIPAWGGQPIPIALGDPQNHFIRLVGWRPDADTVVFARFTRLLDAVELFEADTTGQVRSIMSETSKTFVRQSTIIWTEPIGCWLIGEGRFLWLSERAGWVQLYVGTFGDGEVRPLTPAGMVVHEVVHWNSTCAWIVASEDGARPYDRHFYRVAIGGDGQVDCLTTEAAVHDVVYSPADGSFHDRWSTPSSPPRCRTIGRDGTSVGISDFDATAWLDDGWHAPEEFAAIAADGKTMLNGVLFPPQRLVEGQLYPLIHWLYGGPQIASAPRRFGPRDDTQVLLHALSDMGYGVFVIDARGTPGRSKAFADTVWRSFAPHVVADQVGALRQVFEARRWIDPTRIGVMGRSWGAHFALRLMAAAPDLYRAGVLVVPGLDPQGGLIYEPYLGLPSEQPDAYADAEPWPCVSALDANVRLLLMAGTLDSPCQWDMQRLSTLLVEADIGHHLLTFAEEEHVFFGPAQKFHDRSVFEFFEATLS